MFEKNKGSLTWVHAFTEDHSTFSSTSTTTVDNYLNRNQILRLNGFEPSDFDSEAASEEMLQLLIKQSEEVNGYISEVKPHPTHPVLNLYYYVQNQGVSKSSGSKDMQTLSGNSQVNKNMVKSITDAAGEPGKIQIKFENADVLKVKELSTAIGTGKQKLKVLLDQGADLLSELKVKKESTTESLQAEVQSALDEATLFMAEVRDTLAKSTLAELQPEEAKLLVQAMQLVLNKALIHTEGLKLKIKQMRPFM